MMGRASAWLVLVVVMQGVAQPVPAQSRSSARTAGRSQPAANALAVRAELASVLLQTRRYDEAAREYRALLVRDPGNSAYRLGLARALAWGKRPRDAERELVILRGQRRSDREIDALLRSVRESLDPDSREAASWLAERPAYGPYRRALARALMREDQPRAALGHYDILLISDTSAALRREAISAQVAAGEHERAAHLLRRVLTRAPGDTALLHTLASVLAQDRQYDAALGEYNRLIARAPSSALYLERAQLKAARRDLAAAESDVNASIRTRASTDAYLLLGDLHRWRGDYDQARSAYERARMHSRNDLKVTAALAQLARDERPIAAFVPAWEEGPGWHMRSGAVSDNQGMVYATAGARHVAELPHGMNGSLDLELRRIAEPAPGLDQDGEAGVAFAAGLSKEFTDGAFLARIGGRGGIAFHAEGSTPTAAITTTGWVGAWGLSLDLATGPAYPSLLTVASVRPDSGEAALTEHTIGAAFGGPADRADIAFAIQRAFISDDNHRTTLQALLRVPITADLNAVMTGTGIWFAERSPLYWDPLTYVAGAAGLEYTNRQSRGLSFASRLLAGPARSVEEIVEPQRSAVVERYALQLSGGGELSYRLDAAEVGGALTYGSARTGAYRRLGASVFLRLLR